MKKKLFIITQNENIFLKNSLKTLINNLPKNIEICGIILLTSSPYGGKKNFISKIFTTLYIFGLDFFQFYVFQTIKSFFSEKIKDILKKNNINFFIVNDNINNNKNLDLIKKFEPDIILSLTANQIFKDSLLSIPKICSLNLHTSLLPSYRGLMPSFWVMKNNEKYSGVSVFIIDKQIDTGNILCQSKFNIEDLTHYELIKKSKKIGVECIISSIIKVLDNNFSFIKNNYKNSYNKFPTRNDIKEFKKLGKKFY